MKNTFFVFFFFAFPRPVLADWYCPYWPDTGSCEETDTGSTLGRCTGITTVSNLPKFPAGTRFNVNAISVIHAQCPAGAECEELWISLNTISDEVGEDAAPWPAHAYLNRGATRAENSVTIHSDQFVKGEEAVIDAGIDWYLGTFFTRYKYEGKNPATLEIRGNCSRWP